MRGQISRITRQGIGVQFATHNPPQLAALREVFAKLPERPEGGAAASARDVTGGAQQGRKRTLEKPSEDAAWINWELLD